MAPKQCGARHRLGRRVGGLRPLLLSLVYRVPILLSVLLNLRASILHRDVLRTCYHLGRTFRASAACCGSPVTTARTATIVASRKVVGSFPGTALRIDSSMEENGSAMRVMAICVTVSAVEPTALETLPSAFVSLDKLP